MSIMSSLNLVRLTSITEKKEKKEEGYSRRPILPETNSTCHKM